MAVRLKARFLSTRVLPTEQYKDFAEHLSKNYLHICQTLGPNLTATRKDEFSKILVNIMHGTGSGKVRPDYVRITRMSLCFTLVGAMNMSYP